MVSQLQDNSVEDNRLITICNLHFLKNSIYPTKLIEMEVKNTDNNWLCSMVEDFLMPQNTLAYLLANDEDLRMRHIRIQHLAVLWLIVVLIIKPLLKDQQI